MDVLLDPNIWVAFLMLTSLEIVLGIDNIIFISILVGKLPPEQQDSARKIGLLDPLSQSDGALRRSVPSAET